MGVASPFFRAFDLARHGVEMLQPDVAYAHPLDGGQAGLAWRDLDRTADGLGRDGRAWRALLGPLVRRWQELAGLAMSDFRHLTLPPTAMARLGLRVLEQGSALWDARFRDVVAPALLTGVAAHALAPPRALVPAGVGLVLATLGHAVGWPLPRGGSQTITDALARDLERHGGRIVTGHRVQHLAELPPARAIVLNIGPRELLRIAGDRVPARYARWLRAFRYGSGACKVDFALSEPVPWTAAGCTLAGTVHLGGAREEIVAAERAVAAGRHAERPFVLAVQPGVVDPGRAPRGHHTLSVYAHVPHNSSLDCSAAVIAQIERFAPGFGDTVVAHHVITAAQQQVHNPNYIGGNIVTGALTPWRTLMRPVPRWDPYTTPIPGAYLCSAATPPGPGVHGMAGVHVARRVLRDRFGIHGDPLEFVRHSAR
ncbi:phytoene desaturase family protein [Longimycelium tulufanense]|nr:NAD(P)/FAD-dependent oxidoreductase [Longimycelium tulufanense]